MTHGATRRVALHYRVYTIRDRLRERQAYNCPLCISKRNSRVRVGGRAVE